MKYEPIGDHAERKRISALIERCEKEQEMSKDTIYREDVREVLKDSVVGMGGDDFCEMGVHIDDIDSIVNAIPSAERPQGEGIEMGQNKDGTHNVKCNQCDSAYKMRGHAKSISTKLKYRFCPHCGARMKGADDEDV